MVGALYLYSTNCYLKRGLFAAKLYVAMFVWICSVVLVVSVVASSARFPRKPFAPLGPEVVVDNREEGYPYFDYRVWATLEREGHCTILENIKINGVCHDGDTALRCSLC